MTWFNLTPTPQFLDWGAERGKNWHRRWLTFMVVVFSMLMSAYSAIWLKNETMALGFLTGGIVKGIEYAYQRRKDES